MKRLRSIMPWVVVFLAASAHAHEVRPGFLEFKEDAAQNLRIVWRQPTAGAYALPLLPDISTGWMRGEPFRTSRSLTTYVREWRIPAPHAALDGATIEVEGLERSITDVLIHIEYANGTELTQMLTPAMPRLRLPMTGAQGDVPVRQYLALGFTHIWTGIDHLLYIVGLVLLVRDMRTLVKTITAFTIAHSLSLAASTLGFLHVPGAPVEACIALSILYVAVAAAHARYGGGDLAQRAPWVMAFGFGLLHGLGFAGALAEVGLPAHDIPIALLLFNIGIEVGQLTFVALLLLAAKTLWRLDPLFASRFTWAPPYLIGSLAAFWLIERTQQIFQT